MIAGDQRTATIEERRRRCKTRVAGGVPSVSVGREGMRSTFQFAAEAGERRGRPAVRRAARPTPLADRLRPKTLDEVVGQDHLLGPGRAARPHGGGAAGSPR